MAAFDTNSDTQPMDTSRAERAGVVATWYDRYGDDVYSYSLAMLRSPTVAAEVTLDVFAAMASSRNRGTSPTEGSVKGSLESEDDRLEAIVRTRAEVRSRSSVGGPASSEEVRPTHEAVLDAIEAFSERDKELLVLTFGIGLGLDELSRVTGVESSHLPDLLARMRRRVETAVGPILLAQEGDDRCSDLTGMLDDGSRSESAELFKAVARHATTCESCLQRRAELTSPTGPLRSALAVAAPEGLRSRLLAAVAAQQPADGLSESRPVREMSDRAMWVLFAVVAIVLGLVGMAVSEQFEPLAPTPVDSEPASVAPTTSTSTTADESPATTVGSGDGATSTSGPGKRGADLGISTDLVDFGQDGISGQFDLINDGADPAEISIETSTPAISLSVGSGEIAPGETLTVELSLDREEIGEGEIDETIVISWDGSSLEVSVTGEHQANPILHSPQTSPGTVQEDTGESCRPTQTTVSARVRDDSSLESVVARWSPDGGGTQETSMIDVGNDIYEGVIGPFVGPRTVEVRIVATDEFGNAGGASVNVIVEECS